MEQDPQTVRNRRGCLIILLILAVFLALYMVVGFSAQPGNEAAHKIPVQTR